MASMRTPLVLDGAMGTSLLSRGLAPAALAEDWLLERPEEIAAVHAEHVAAGAQIVLTCTFNLASPRRGDRSVEHLANRAVALARASGARVAGAVGPAAAAGADLARWCAPALEALAGAGVDLLWAETQWDLAEARATLQRARRCEVPVVITLSFTEGEPPRLPGGGLVADALLVLAGDGAAAVGVNCVAPSSTLARLIADVAPRLGLPLVVKPSPGLPGAVLAPGEFARRVSRLVDAGAAWVGGCCGAGAAHVAAIATTCGQVPRG
jgi:5-methyltetrahydrofolate--homocysteine methyltransferase